jgi:hypothetical protein
MIEVPPLLQLAADISRQMAVSSDRDKSACLQAAECHSDRASRRFVGCRRDPPARIRYINVERIIGDQVEKCSGGGSLLQI